MKNKEQLKSLRVDKDTHKQAIVKANKKGMTIKGFVKFAIDKVKA